MGEVYTARDTRLDRTVAIKVLPARVADDPQFRDRFEREAKAVAALTHPHICTLHDVGETGDGHAFLVMELLQGETAAAAARARTARGGARRRSGDRAGRWARRRASCRHRASRHQAGEHLSDRARAEDPRLRSGQSRSALRGRGVDAVDDGAESAVDRAWQYGRHRRVHVARTTARRGTRCADRPLLAGPGALRNGDRTSGIRRRDQRGDLGRDSAHDAAGAAGRPARPAAGLEGVILKAIEKDRAPALPARVGHSRRPPASEGGHESDRRQPRAESSVEVRDRCRGRAHSGGGRGLLQAAAHACQHRSRTKI